MSLLCSDAPRPIVKEDESAFAPSFPPQPTPNLTRLLRPLADSSRSASFPTTNPHSSLAQSPYADLAQWEDVLRTRRDRRRTPESCRVLAVVERYETDARIITGGNAAEQGESI